MVIVNERNRMKWAALAIVVLLLVGAALIQGGVFESGEEGGDDDSSLLQADGKDPELATGVKRPGEAPHEVTARAKEGTTQPDSEGVTAPDPQAAATEPEGAGTKPAVRRSPFGPPKRKPGSRILPGGGGGPGSGGPTGHWTRFGPMPKPKGTARIAVTVEDEDGRPLAGADVFLGPPDTAGVEGISFGDLRMVGKTNADGVLHAGELPEGAAAVFGNRNNRLNGRLGLDGRHGVKTTLQSGQSVSVKVRLPFSTAKIGTIAGRVTGPAGQPVRSSVSTGYVQQWTKEDGRFSLSGIEAGRATIAIRATGFASQRVNTEVVAGVTTQVQVELTYADAGTMRIEGAVVGPQDEPVEGATVYLMMERERGTLRRATTDAMGRFRMEQLPERVRTEAGRLQASRMPHYATKLLRFETGVKDERVRLKLPIRYVQLELLVLDATNGEPIRQVIATAERPESKRSVANLIYQKGYRRGMVEPGRHTVRIDALDHEDVEFDLDVVPDTEGRCGHEVSLKRVSPPSVQVALTITLTDAVTGAPVGRARVEVLEGDGGQPLSRFEGRRADGAYRMPAPSGKRRLAITADGYEPHDAPLDLKASEPEVALEIQLPPR